jgi:hypothetical protein
LIKKLLLLDQALVTDTVRHYLKSPEHYGLIAREWTKRFVEATVNSQLFCSNIALYTIKHLAVHIEAKVEKNKKVTTWLYHTLLSSSHKFAHVVYHES